jgi:hypothetical protein
MGGAGIYLASPTCWRVYEIMASTRLDVPAGSKPVSRSLMQGQIGYFGAGGRDIGREHFQIRQTGQRQRSLLAICELPDSRMVRSCQLEVDCDRQQTEAFVRVEEDNQWLCSARYEVGTKAIEVALFRRGAAAEHKQAEGGSSRFFGTHSLINDGWLPALTRGSGGEGGITTFANLPTCSLRGDGGGVPDLLFCSGWFEPLEDRTVKVTAGSFECQGWRVGYGEHPPLDIWLSKDLQVMVLMDWPKISCRYELLQFSNLLADQH